MCLQYAGPGAVAVLKVFMANAKPAKTGLTPALYDGLRTIFGNEMEVVVNY